MRRLLILALVFVLAACGGKSTPQTTTNAAGCVPMTAPPAAARAGKKPTQPLDSTKTYVITMQTNCGTFAFTLDPKQSPNASASFVALTKAGYFNDTTFHRIVPGFVIQGGDPTATGTGGPGYATVDKPPANAAYTHGVVAMAKTGAQANGTAGSQFFIVTVKNAGLPPQYAIIGTVTSGLAVVDRIGKLGNANDPSGTPTEVVVIEKATVTTS